MKLLITQKGANKMSNTFYHLSDNEVKAKFKKYKAQGMSDDDAFTEIYSEDCAMDGE